MTKPRLWWAVLFAVAGGISCGGEDGFEPGLMVAITSELVYPKDFDSLNISVRQGGALKLSKDYDVRSGLSSLPATLAVITGKEVDASLSIKLTANLKAEARIVREIKVNPVADRLALLPVELDFLCLDRVRPGTLGDFRSECEMGETCVQGRCAATSIDASALATYAPLAVFGGGAGPGEGACFDVAKCFVDAATASLPQARLDLDSCRVPLPPGQGQPNIAVVMPAGGVGVCEADRCRVALTAGMAGGWRIEGSEIVLPRGVCLNSQALGVEISYACPPKPMSLPLCAAATK